MTFIGDFVKLCIACHTLFRKQHNVSGCVRAQCFSFIWLLLTNVIEFSLSCVYSTVEVDGWLFQIFYISVAHAHSKSKDTSKSTDYSSSSYFVVILSKTIHSRNNYIHPGNY